MGWLLLISHMYPALWNSMSLITTNQIFEWGRETWSVPAGWGKGQGAGFSNARWCGWGKNEYFLSACERVERAEPGYSKDTRRFRRAYVSPRRSCANALFFPAPFCLFSAGMKARVRKDMRKAVWGWTRLLALNKISAFTELRFKEIGRATPKP